MYSHTIYITHAHTHTHTCAGPNVLVFDGGRRVKLADFGTAVHINDISSVGKNLVGCTPYYAPPEVIQQGVPHFSADIWGVLCVFVEMLTAKMPGCYKQEKPYLAMMYLVRLLTHNGIAFFNMYSKQLHDSINRLIAINSQFLVRRVINRTGFLGRTPQHNSMVKT